jgi:co-chaperonin GroES (HSP10)
VTQWLETRTNATPVKNTSGVDPLDMRVVVLPDAVAKKTAGGIILPDEAVEQKKYATVKATLVAVGANAWAEAKAARDFIAPEPGARVMVAKYGGVVFEGADGKDYRIMNDEDVVALLVDEET